MTTPNYKPSEMAMELATGILGDWDVSYAAQVMTASIIDAALACAREEARREALEEAAKMCGDLGRIRNPSEDDEDAYIAEVTLHARRYGSHPTTVRFAARWIGERIRALIPNTPQGETKEQQP